MTMSILLLVGMVVCYAAGVSLMLERSLTRMVLGFLLIGNATNLLIFFMSGSFGLAPLFEAGVDPSEYSDPLPQAFILTAIVITFGVTAFMLALVYRSWRLAQQDTVADDEEDIAMRHVDPSLDDETFDEDDAGDTEFGTSAEAAVSTASIDLQELETLEADEAERAADRAAIERDLDDSDGETPSGDDVASHDADDPDGTDDPTRGGRA